MKMIQGKAVLITGGLLHDIHAKTAHGLLRSGDRFEITAVIDEENAGKDINKLLGDNKLKDVPVLKNFEEMRNRSIEAEYAIIGVATKGGIIPGSLRKIIVEAIELDLSVVNGLHEHLGDIPEIRELAHSRGVEIHDIRKPKKFKDLRFWSGEIAQVACPKIAVLGTDCALGKRTTARLITESLTIGGEKAEMIYTGQTGWMQGGKYGFIFDATLNDFISGEIETAILDCYKNENPDYIIVEGQSALRNPSGPCGSEFIVSGNLDGVVLQHAPGRAKYKDLNYHAQIPPVADEIALIKMYGTNTLGVCLNTSGIDPEQAKKFADTLEGELNIPVVRPLYEGVERITREIKNIKSE